MVKWKIIIFNSLCSPVSPPVYNVQTRLTMFCCGLGAPFSKETTPWILFLSAFHWTPLSCLVPVTFTHNPVQLRPRITLAYRMTKSPPCSLCKSLYIGSLGLVLWGHILYDHLLTTFHFTTSKALSSCWLSSHFTFLRLEEREEGKTSPLCS